MPKKSKQTPKLMRELYSTFQVLNYEGLKQIAEKNNRPDLIDLHAAASEALIEALWWERRLTQFPSQGHINDEGDKEMLSDAIDAYEVAFKEAEDAIASLESAIGL